MKLDGLDHAFLSRWEALATPPTVTTAARPAAKSVVGEPAVVVGEPARPEGVVGRLLEVAETEWLGLADEIEGARARGRRAIAVVAAERGVGCSTIIATLAHVLRGRGRDVVVCTGREAAADLGGGGTAHDKRIVLVDGGIWFPSGPIRRQRLISCSIGCDAAILVRRPDAQPLPAWAVSLEAIGVEPLGEILSSGAAGHDVETAEAAT